ncbi:hypothetical protein [Haloferax sp. KTX1]|uniref:hypothetical protein n=1 Tax=Haloferax sp. KTX1 TaxID=2600597 RepID=UPI0011DCEE8F|nr:hypothetical protein [Haloferax sp. KTX1]
MRDLDEIDPQTVQLSMSNARRLYSDIADIVGLSAPAVSACVASPEEIGAMAFSSVSVLSNSLSFPRYIPDHDYELLGSLVD